MTLEELMQTQIAELSDHDALQHIGVLIDESTDAIWAKGMIAPAKFSTNFRSAR